MGLSDAAEEQNVIIPWNDEDDSVRVMDGVCSNGQCRGHLWEVDSVVDDSNQATPDGIASFVACNLCPSQACAVHNDVCSEPCSKFVLLGIQVTVDGLGLKSGSFALHHCHQPLHTHVCVDDGSNVLVGVDSTICWVNVEFLD